MSREDNRTNMPTIAAFVDQIRSVFGPVKVLWARENGHEVGKVPEPEGLVIGGAAFVEGCRNLKQTNWRQS